MPLTPDRCICLRKVEYSETSQILTLFAREHGIQRVLAKGAHRRTKQGSSKFDGGVDLLDVGDAIFTIRSERDLGLLTEWSLREGHLALRQNLRGMYLGLYAAELVSLLFEEHDPHPDLFDRLEVTLPLLATPEVEEAFLAFELDMLRESGYLPELTVCVGCRNPFSENAPAYFSPASGGMVCRDCEGAIPDRRPLEPKLVGLLQSMVKLPRANGSPRRLPQLTRHQTDPLNRVFASHMQHTLGRRIRMTGYVL